MFKENEEADTNSKESRAEQNRKAQQVFRRKREEKMKQLEIDALALAGTRARLQAAEERILSLALVSVARECGGSGQVQLAALAQLRSTRH